MAAGARALPGRIESVRRLMVLLGGGGTDHQA